MTRCVVGPVSSTDGPYLITTQELLLRSVSFAQLMFGKSQRRVRLARLFELLPLLRGCGRRSCCCRFLVVGNVAVAPIVLSVAVDAADGEPVRNTSVLRN